MNLLITKASGQVTIQDLGRSGFQSQGVPISGPMDDDAMFHANALVGNNINDACIEVGSGSVELKINAGSLISHTGHGHRLFLFDREMPSYKAIFIHEEANLRLKPNSDGVWSYLSIGGGINVKEILKSKSTYLPAKFGGFKGRALTKGDSIECFKKKSIINDSIIKSLSLNHDQVNIANWSTWFGNHYPNDVRIFSGPEWSWLSADQQKKLLSGQFRISSDSNRMGYRLDGEVIKREVSNEMISSGVTRGTIQLTESGLIVLMADSQTVGGYPRIAQVAVVDLPPLSQQPPGTEFQFKMITHGEAEQLFLLRESDRKKILQGIRLRYL